MSNADRAGRLAAEAERDELRAALTVSERERRQAEEELSDLRTIHGEVEREFISLHDALIEQFAITESLSCAAPPPEEGGSP